MSKPKRGRFRRFRIMLLLSLVCVAVDNIYAIFGHGVRSPAMSLMFLYPLGGGAAYLLLEWLAPENDSGGLRRLGVNLLNSGIAALTVGAFLQGILEIAGSSSPYLPIFSAMGWAFSAAGLAVLVAAGLKR